MAAGNQTQLAKTVAQFKERNQRLGLSPRQMRLNKLWAFYRCQQYESRSIRWDGTKVEDAIEHEAISSIGYIPPGFYDAGGQSGALPLRYRRPTAPYNLSKVIVDRFTGLLFSEQRHPVFGVEGNPEAESFLEKLADASRVWAAMIQARNYGGATGTVCIGFSYVDGRPVVEVHDPRWLYPDFSDRMQLKLRRLEKRFQYPVDVQNRDTGAWEEKAFWYRRVWDKTSDVVFEPVEVGNGDEPEWREASRVNHELGFVPAVWTQNLPVSEDIDGDPDCHGIYDLIESHDALVAQSYKALIANCDPTAVITSDADNLKDITIGSDNALKLPAGSDAKWMEHNGEGPKATLELAGKLREMALEVAQCVLEQDNDNQPPTATEINRRYSSMLSRGDVLREQYGQKAVLPLMLMLVKAAEILGAPEALADGTTERQGILLSDSSELFVVPPGLLSGSEPVKLNWPPYFEPSLDDVTKASQAATTAFTGKLIDRTHAVKYIAPFFDVDNVQELVDTLDAEQEAQDQQMMSMMNNGDGGGAPPGEDGGGEPPMQRPKPKKPGDGPI